MAAGEAKKKRAGRTTARQTGGLAASCNVRASGVRADLQGSAGAAFTPNLCKKVQQMQFVQPLASAVAAELAAADDAAEMAHLVIGGQHKF